MSPSTTNLNRCLGDFFTHGWQCLPHVDQLTFVHETRTICLWTWPFYTNMCICVFHLSHIHRRKLDIDTQCMRSTHVVNRCITHQSCNCIAQWFVGFLQCSATKWWQIAQIQQHLAMAWYGVHMCCRIPQTANINESDSPWMANPCALCLHSCGHMWFQ